MNGYNHVEIQIVPLLVDLHYISDKRGTWCIKFLSWFAFCLPEVEAVEVLSNICPCLCFWMANSATKYLELFVHGIEEHGWGLAHEDKIWKLAECWLKELNDRFGKWLDKCSRFLFKRNYLKRMRVSRVQAVKAIYNSSFALQSSKIA